MMVPFLSFYFFFFFVTSENLKEGEDSRVKMAPIKTRKGRISDVAVDILVQALPPLSV